MYKRLFVEYSDIQAKYCAILDSEKPYKITSMVLNEDVAVWSVDVNTTAASSRVSVIFSKLFPFKAPAVMSVNSATVIELETTHALWTVRSRMDSVLLEVAEKLAAQK